jgi:hypothetical protein
LIRKHALTIQKNFTEINLEPNQPQCTGGAASPDPNRRGNLRIAKGSPFLSLIELYIQ